MLCSGLLISLSACFLGWGLVLPGVYLITMLPFIKDVELNVFDDRFELDHISTIKLFSIKEVFIFRDIKTIKFDKGFTNILGVVLYERVASGLETYSKKDTIEVTRYDGSWRTIGRVGSKENFLKACETIVNELNSHNN